MATELNPVEHPISRFTVPVLRQWWRELPGYWRIATWSVGGLFALNLAWLIYIAWNYWEATAIVSLRQRGVDIQYQWNRVWWEPTGRWKSDVEQELWSAICGRNCRNVGAAIIEMPGNQDELVQEVCRLLPNLECLIVRDAELSESTLKAVSQCPRLKWIALTGCDITDRGVQILARHQGWVGIYLQGTLITDATLPALQQMNTLRFLNISDTEITPSAITAWQALPETAKVRLFQNQTDKDFRLRIVWPDGRKDSEFPPPFQLTADGPFAEDVPESFTDVPRRVLNRQDYVGKTVQAAGDGNYRLTISYGDYSAAPVIIEVRNGKLLPGSFEFRMPVTKAVATKQPVKTP